MTGRRGRLSKLEGEAEARQKEAAERLPVSHALAYLCDVLSIVHEEAGPAVAGRTLARAVGPLEALAARAGVRL